MASKKYITQVLLTPPRTRMLVYIIQQQRHDLLQLPVVDGRFQGLDPFQVIQGRLGKVRGLVNRASPAAGGWARKQKKKHKKLVATVSDFLSVGFSIAHRQPSRVSTVFLR